MRKHTAFFLLSSVCLAAFGGSRSDIENADSIASASSASAIEHPDTVGHDLSEVVVTEVRASREAQSSAPLHIVTAEEILRTGITDVSDALHRMPGVNLRDYGGAGGLKTVSVRGFGAGHTGVFYDGIPLSDVQSGQIDLSRYSIDNVANVSMVVGDNDDIFIPARLAASAATVSISTQPTPGTFELTAKMRAGSFGFYNPFVKVGVPIGSGSAMNFVGEFVHADNDYPFKLRNGSVVTKEKRTNSRMNSGHGEINLFSRLDSRNTLSAKVYYYNNSRQLPGPVVYYNNVNHEHLAEQNVMAQAQVQSRLSSVFSLKGIAKFNYATSFYHDENGKYPGGVLDQNYWQREYYASCALLCTPLLQWSFDYSIDYFFNNLNSNLRSDSRPYRNSLLQTLSAKYHIDRLTVMARLLGSLYFNGAREGTPSRDAKKLSPSVSLSWQPLGEQLLFLRTSYKNIFRMPTFSEAYFDHFGSVDVLPESTDQVNLGATYTLKGEGWMPLMTFSIDGYFNSIRDMIVAVPYNMFVWSVTNLGKVWSVGVDATAELHFVAHRGHELILSGNYSYQRAMPRTNPEASDWMKQVAYIPRHSGSASLSYEGPWVSASIYGTGVSHRFTTNTNVAATRIDGYVELGASLWHTFPVKRHSIDVRLDVQNLLDKQYCIVARYPMPGRAFRFTLTFKY